MLSFYIFGFIQYTQRFMVLNFTRTRQKNLLKQNNLFRTNKYWFIAQKLKYLVGGTCHPPWDWASGTLCCHKKSRRKQNIIVKCSEANNRQNIFWSRASPHFRFEVFALMSSQRFIDMVYPIRLCTMRSHNGKKVEIGWWPNTAKQLKNWIMIHNKETKQLRVIYERVSTFIVYVN